jgi:hypothetical protein
MVIPNLCRAIVLVLNILVLGISLADDAVDFPPDQKSSAELYTNIRSELLHDMKKMDACLSYLENSKTAPSLAGVCSVFGEMKKRKEQIDQMSRAADRSLAYERKHGSLSPLDDRQIRNLQYELSDLYSGIADRVERLLALDTAYKDRRRQDK